jgi:hypothetical protein
MVSSCPVRRETGTPAPSGVTRSHHRGASTSIQTRAPCGTFVMTFCHGGYRMEDAIEVLKRALAVQATVEG